ncbi:hypothetical protein [Fulvimarina sp. MAC8]|uniref:hypothetical protein n=1 Tax=Fulvimarina sp. MAC8 TaxID=3162874 RepID=UPI0032EE8492
MVDDKPQSLAKSSGGKTRRYEVDQPDETERQKALRDKVEAAARGGRILAERSHHMTTEPRREETDVDEVRKPTRRYRKRQPVRSIDPKEYEGDHRALDRTAKTVRSDEASFGSTSKPKTDQLVAGLAGLNYRARRLGRTGGVALGDRWKARSGIRKQVRKRGFKTPR